MYGRRRIKSITRMKRMTIINKESKKCLNFNGSSRKGAGSNPDNVIGFF
jgi:hypothetical protein